MLKPLTAGQLAKFFADQDPSAEVLVVADETGSWVPLAQVRTDTAIRVEVRTFPCSRPELRFARPGEGFDESNTVNVVLLDSQVESG